MPGTNNLEVQQLKVERQVLNQVDIHFAGDSGDGMQVVGLRFSESCAQQGNDIRTLPDFPAEIRAPSGTVAGVSGFQISFSSAQIYVPGDQFDVLVAMNPAALKSALLGLKKGGILIIDSDKLTPKDLEKAGYQHNPLDSGILDNYRVVPIALTSLTLQSLDGINIARSAARKCKNFYVLGLIDYLYQRSLEPTKSWIQEKFKQEPNIAKANLTVLRAGYNYAITTELFREYYNVFSADLPKGTYKQLTGNQALVLGCVSVAAQNNHQLFMAGYPITPASDILHELSRYPHVGIKTFQAEDEMAAVGSALGAAYAGELAMTATSGPGMDLISETLGLAVMCELPLVVVNVQRAGPSTGMPTKVEQSDLNQALYGRHGEAPLPVLAAKSAVDCFAMIRLAFKIAVEYMTPVILLSDANLSNSSEPWRIPDISELESDRTEKLFFNDAENFKPYKRNSDTLARAWAIPGTAEHEHRIGGLEKQDISGNISSDPKNHQNMVSLRKQKIKNIAKALPNIEYLGADFGDVLVVGWGSVYGACKSAVKQLQGNNYSISYVHLQSLYPFQIKLVDWLSQFKTILVVELNDGQLCQLLRAEFLVDAQSIAKVQGKPFHVSELIEQFLKYFPRQEN
tara:strand:- start:35717 stop:37597 length:1881 start_codon:yes stop_codon:yes gene_type:complete